MSDFVTEYKRVSDNISNAYNKLEEKCAKMPTRKANRLPEEYQEVEYLESTGTQWIDTGYIPNSNTVWELDVELKGSPIRFGRHGNGQRFAVYARNDLVEMSMGDYKQQYFSVLNKRKIFKWDVPKLQATISDISYIWNFNSIDWTDTNSLYLFGRNANTTIDDIGSAKLYRSIISENNILIQDLVPCYRKLDGEKGLYDLINGTFYINKGTGKFIVGNDVIVPDNKNSENLAKTIESINIEWEPEPDWWNIDKILKEDNENYPAKMIVLVKNTKDATKIVLNNTNKAVKVVTSDGATYTETVTYSWDKSKDKECSYGYKTRYYIVYFSDTNTYWNYDELLPREEVLYFICENLNITSSTNYNVPLAYCKFLESFKMKNSYFLNTNASRYFFQCNNIRYIPDDIFTNEIESIEAMFMDCIFLTKLPKFKLTTSKTISTAKWLCSGCSGLRELDFDFSKILNINDILTNARSLQKIYNFDLTSCTSNGNFMNYANSIRYIKNVKDIKVDNLNFDQSNQWYKESLINILNGLHDYSGGETHTVKFGATNIAKLTAEELAIGQNKNWTIS